MYPDELLLAVLLVRTLELLKTALAKAMSLLEKLQVVQILVDLRVEMWGKSIIVTVKQQLKVPFGVGAW